MVAGPDGSSSPASHHLRPYRWQKLRRTLSVGVSGINVANRRFLLDNSLTFGGTHFINPREIFVQLRYHFHY